MRFTFVIAAILIALCAFGQIDTVYYTPNEYSISLTKDSCNTSINSNHSNIKKYLVLGSPDEICDRTYYKNGFVYDRKRTWNFGYAYAQYDTSGMVRKHYVKNNLLQYTLVLEITSRGQVFFSHVEAKEPTNYFLQPDGRFEKITTNLNHPKDGVLTKQVRSLINRYGPNSKSTQMAYLPLQYAIHFLRNGMIESAGYYYTTPGNKQVKIGVWSQYNIFCDCYEEREYFVK